MSNILAREIVFAYRWLRTYVPYRLERKGPIMTRIVRRALRVQLRRNRVWAAVVTRLVNLARAVAAWPLKRGSDVD